LVRDDGQVLVTDVGLLPALRLAAASSARPWGRAPYLSPEQAAGESVHPSSDVYVIGSLLYHMLAGRPPFYGQDETVLAMRHLRQDPPSLEVLVPDIPPALAQIVHKALAKEPAARYRNAGQLAHILSSQLGPDLTSGSLDRITPARPTPGAPEPAVPVQAPQRERLVVPAPPPDETYGPVSRFEDWLMVVLIVAALIAVLGLIPLWRAVYRRYAAPPPSPPPALYQPLPQDIAWLPLMPGAAANEAKVGTKLDNFGLVWYNLSIAAHLVSGSMPRSMTARGSTIFGRLAGECESPEFWPGWGPELGCTERVVVRCDCIA
jgi:hypothetical protein